MRQLLAVCALLVAGCTSGPGGPSERGAMFASCSRYSDAGPVEQCKAATEQGAEAGFDPYKERVECMPKPGGPLADACTFRCNDAGTWEACQEMGGLCWDDGRGFKCWPEATVRNAERGIACTDSPRVEHCWELSD